VPRASDDLEAGQIAERGAAGGFARAQIEAGVVPRTADGALDDEPFRQRPAVVRAGRPDREQIRPALDEDHGLSVRVAEQRNAVRQALDGDARDEVGPARNRWLAHVSRSLTLAAVPVGDRVGGRARQ